MKILVTGAKGQLGYDLCKQLKARKIDFIGIDIADCDLTQPEQVEQVFMRYLPNTVIHCAAYTAVDKAEDEADICRRVNVDATANVANACKKYHAAMMYISTDYVFAGKGEKAFEVYEPYAPQNAYGKTKAEGEMIVRDLLERYFIVRISWVFGINGNNFVKTMRRLGAQRESLNVVSDQVGSPTYTYDLSKLLVDIVLSQKYGIYHATNEGYCSWAEFAEAVMQLSNLKCKICPVATTEYVTAASRPLNSRLSKTSLDTAGFTRLPSWKDALARFINEMNAQ